MYLSLSFRFQKNKSSHLSVRNYARDCNQHLSISGSHFNHIKTTNTILKMQVIMVVEKTIKQNLTFMGEGVGLFWVICATIDSTYRD